jgi:hypothetical protein
MAFGERECHPYRYVSKETTIVFSSHVGTFILTKQLLLDLQEVTRGASTRAMTRRRSSGLKWPIDLVGDTDTALRNGSK